MPKTSFADRFSATLREPNPEVMEASRRAISDYSGFLSVLRMPTGHLLVTYSWASNVKDPHEHLRHWLDGDRTPDTWANGIDLYDEKDRLLCAH